MKTFKLSGLFKDLALCKHLSCQAYSSTSKKFQCSKPSVCKHFNTNRNNKNIKKQRRCSELSVCKHFSKNVIKNKKERLSSKLWISKHLQHWEQRSWQ
jgi:hypothetical protein